MIHVVFLDGPPVAIARAEQLLQQAGDGWARVKPQVWMVANRFLGTQQLRDHVATEAPDVQILVMQLSGAWGAVRWSAEITAWLQGSQHAF